MMNTKRPLGERGFSLLVTIVVIAVLVILAGVAVPKFISVTEEAKSTTSTLREIDPAVSTRAACEAGCRNQYGGSGSAGFDACMRSCGAGGVLREECPSDRPACPSGESVVCRRGVWYCRDAGTRVFPETNNFNFPTDAQMREGACGEPGLACEVPTTPVCKNGKWICVGPASPGTSVVPTPPPQPQPTPQPSSAQTQEPSPAAPGSTNSPQAAPTPQRAPKTVNVSIQGFAFSPATVTIKVGDVVVFKNFDSVGHTATQNGGGFDTGLLSQGQSKSITFSQKGTFNYHCTPHPNMTGTILVE